MIDSPALYRQRFIDVGEEATDCMALAGFDLVKTPVPDLEWWDRAADAAVIAAADYLVTMDEADAGNQAFGIALAASTAEAGEVYNPFPDPDFDGDPLAASEEEVEYMLALYGRTVEGSPESELEGCYSKAQSLVGRVDPPIADDLYEETIERAMATPEFDRIATEWQQCVGDDGYDLGDNPLALGLITENLLANFEQGEVSDLEQYERAAAGVFVTCISPHRTTLLTLMDPGEN